MLGEPLLDLAAADPGIEQQLDAVRLDVDAVAVAAGLEGDDLHGKIVPQIVVMGYNALSNAKKPTQITTMGSSPQNV